MRNPAVQQKLAPGRLMGVDLAQALGALITFILVLVAGAVISAALPDHASAWLVASAYLAPASMAFAIRWWMAQRD